MTRATLALARARQRLEDRLDQLDQRLAAGDDSVWAAFCDTARTLAALITDAGAGGHAQELLSTAAMAARLGIKPKTLLKLEREGKVKSIKLGERGTASRRWSA